jgi:membrane-associated phospholipid phosphatase
VKGSLVSIGPGPDVGLFEDVNRFARDTSWLHAAALGYAGYGLALFAVLLLAAWWRARGRNPKAVAAAVWAGGAPVIALVVNQPFVGIFHEARPYTTLPGILVLAQPSADFSFPSDHAVMAGAAAAGLWLCSRGLAAVATAAAVLMALARVYIGAHYPHDVAVGLLFGALVALVGWWVLRRPLTAAATHLAGTALWPLVRTRPGPQVAAPTP